MKATNLRPRGRCRCGLSNATCADEWDKRLGIVAHSSDAQSGVSHYEKNRRAIAVAKANGEDPYHNRLNSRSGH